MVKPVTAVAVKSKIIPKKKSGGRIKRMCQNSRWRARFLRILENNAGGNLNRAFEIMKVSGSQVFKERQIDPDFDALVIDAMHNGKVNHKLKMDQTTRHIDDLMGEKMIEALKSGQIELKASDINTFLKDHRGSQGAGNTTVKVNNLNQNSNVNENNNQLNNQVNNDNSQKSVNVYANLSVDDLRKLKTLTDKAKGVNVESDESKLRVVRGESEMVLDQG